MNLKDSVFLNTLTNPLVWWTPLNLSSYPPHSYEGMFEGKQTIERIRTQERSVNSTPSTTTNENQCRSSSYASSDKAYLSIVLVHDLCLNDGLVLDQLRVALNNHVRLNGMIQCHEASVLKELTRRWNWAVFGLEREREGKAYLKGDGRHDQDPMEAILIEGGEMNKESLWWWIKPSWSLSNDNVDSERIAWSISDCFPSHIWAHLCLRKKAGQRLTWRPSFAHLMGSTYQVDESDLALAYHRSQDRANQSIGTRIAEALIQRLDPRFGQFDLVQ